jgi:hypothetical protein
MHRDLAALERGERPGKSRTKILLATTSILVVAVAGVWFWLNHPQPNVGLHLQMTVRTEPPGALVVLGDHAQKSPATFADLEPRKYNLRIMSPGYEPVESAVDLSGKRSFDPPPFRLVRSKGALEIQSEPAGAQFSIRSQDGVVSRAGTTPHRSSISQREIFGRGASRRLGNARRNRSQSRKPLARLGVRSATTNITASRWSRFCGRKIAPRSTWLITGAVAMN